MSKKIKPVKKTSKPGRAKFTPGQPVIFQGRHAEVISVGPSHAELQTGGSERQKVPLSAIVTLLLALCFVVAGCKTGGGIYKATPVVSQAEHTSRQTNLVETVTPVEVVSTVPGGISVTNTTFHTNVLSQIVRVTNTVPVTNFTYAVSPKTQAVIDTGGAVAAAVPSPWKEIAGGTFALASVVLGYIANRKSAQNKELSEQIAEGSDELVSVGNQLAVVVAGVEMAKISDEASKVVKDAIQKEASLAGVQSDLHKTVQTLT